MNLKQNETINDVTINSIEGGLLSNSNNINDILEFIKNNYVWFIIGGVALIVVVMVIIKKKK